MRVRGFGFVIGVLALGVLFGPSHFATRAINAESQPPRLTAIASPSASAARARVGPSYLYPDPKATPGAVNPGCRHCMHDRTGWNRWAPPLTPREKT